MAHLTYHDGQRTIAFPLPEGSIVIGRNPTSGLPINGSTVSGTHARLTREGGAAFLEDLNSRNGTFINGQRVTAKMQLRHNDRIAFGQVMMVFEDGAQVGGPFVPGATPFPAPTAPIPGMPAQSSVMPVAFPAPQPFPAPPPPFAPSPLTGPAPVGTVNMAKPQLAAFPSPAGRPDTGTATYDSDLQVTITGEDDQPNITGAVENTGRFGLLEVNSEAKLRAVLQISTSLAGTPDLPSLLPKILDTLFGIFPYADRGCILLKDSVSGQMVPRASRHRRAGEDATVRLSRTIVNKVLQDKAGVLSADVATDAQFSSSASLADLKIRSMMCVPLLGLDGEPTGIISIDSQNPLGQFKSEDLDLLMAVAGQAALSFESARLLDVFIAKKKQDGELSIARDVQKGLLPQNAPSVPGYEFFASYDSAQQVGGDYYDYFLLGDGKIALSFGDVAGKGVPGALIMARMASAVQGTIRFCHEVIPAMQAINDHMCNSAVEGRFVTYILAILNTNTHEVTLANAGHMSPLIRRADGTVDQFSDDIVGPPIAVMEGYEYEVETRVIQPGETVVIVTDGVDEALNPAGELYTKERVVEFVQRASPKADELGRALLADVRRHAAGRAQSDDITIMTFGRNP